jgi:tRNA(His) guanylyltransferase
MGDDLGDRMKEYEQAEAGRRLMPLLPALARIDGRCFSAFTRGLERPYDVRLSLAMIETTRFLVEECNACAGYTQSDEISLAWLSTNYNSQIFFDGKIQKMVSALAALATLRFNTLVADNLPAAYHGRATFDCRVWNVPSIEEGANAFLWREIDATKNSVAMAARAYYSHREIDGKGRADMQDMLHANGVNWNDYPAFFKRGTYIQRRIVSKAFTADELERLPPKHEARRNPELTIERSEYAEIDMPPLGRVTNRARVLFFGEQPLTGGDFYL